MNTRHWAARSSSLALGLAIACSVAAPPAQAQAPASAPARTATVELREVTTEYAADAVIEAVRQATVSAQIAGTLVELAVDAGDRVRRGQLLARIDTRETDAQLAASRAQIAQAEAALAQARVSHDRTTSLVKQNFLSQAAADKSLADLRSAQAALDAARAGATGAQTARSFAELRAPIDGVVTRRLMERGELATPGRAVLELHDPAGLRAVASVPQFALPQVRGAKTARIEVPALGGMFEARSVTVLPAADPRLLATQVRAELPQPAPAGLAPGMAAKVRLPTGAAKRLVVPAGALVRRGELVLASVIGADGKPALRQVRIGEPYAGGLVEVLAGLAAGERVALDPLAATAAPAR